VTVCPVNGLDSGAQVEETSAPEIGVESRANSSNSPALSRDCHDTEPPSEERLDVGRDESGRFRRGNTAALTHGLRSRQVQHGLLLPPGAALPAERAAAVLTDLGDVSTITSGLVRRYVHLELLAEWLEGNLLAQGALTTKGHRRAAVDAYLGVVDRLARLGSTLGLERRTKPVQSASAIIAEASR
jgi:hypothetical protein